MAEWQKSKKSEFENDSVKEFIQLCKMVLFLVDLRLQLPWNSKTIINVGKQKK